MAQYSAFGHAIPGIVEPTLEEYTHLGDAASKTDGKIYDSHMGLLESNGISSGLPDDRWAFTTHTTALNYGAVAALAAASRVLRGYDDALAEKCLKTAIQVWGDERSHPPVIFQSFNTTGGDPDEEEVTATVQLLITTKGRAPYKARLKELLPVIQKKVGTLGWIAVQAIPYMGTDFKKALAAAVTDFKPKLDAELAKNPFGVPISLGTWGRLRRRCGLCRLDVLPAPGIPQHRRSRLYPAGIRLRAGPASRFQRIVCFVGRDVFKAGRVWQQPGGLHVHSRRHDSRGDRHPT